MLRSIPTEDRELDQQQAEMPWPPAIKPPSLRALPTPYQEASRPVARGQASQRIWQRMSAWLWVWLAVYVSLNVGDLASTYVGLHSGLHEGNPLMRTLLDQHGFGALIVYKVIVVVAVAVGLGALYRRHPRLAGVTLAVCNVLVGLAVVANLVQFAMI